MGQGEESDRKRKCKCDHKCASIPTCYDNLFDGTIRLDRFDRDGNSGEDAGLLSPHGLCSMCRNVVGLGGGPHSGGIGESDC